MPSPTEASPLIAISRAEERSLRASLVISAVVSAVTLALGLVAGSQVLMLEAAFGLIGLAATWLALQASRAADRRPTSRYPYGLDSLIPLVVALQGIAMGATLIYAVASAVVVILDGGHVVNAGVVAAVAGAGGITSLVFARWLGRLDPGSDLIAAERAQWHAGGLRSLIAAGGALIAVWLTASGGDAAARYVDPVLVLVAAAIVARMPVRLVRHGINELLEGAPDAETMGVLRGAVDSVTASMGLPRPRVRATKLGLKVYLDVRYPVDSPEVTVGFEDEVRRAMADAVSHLPLDVWASVELTARAEPEPEPGAA